MENFKQVLKRTTAVLMIAVLLIGIAPIGSLADVDWSEFALTASAAEREGYFTYYVSGGKAMIDYVDTGISGTVYVPSTLGGYPVTEIESSAFQRCKAMTSVIIPDSVLEIGNSAFYNCTGLTYVKLSENLSEIKSETFAGCEKITEITIPDSVTSIGTWAFQNCFSLVDVHIGKNVKSISNCAFYNCNGLKNIKIPNSVTSMGDSAFEHCSSLEDVIIGSGVTKLSYDLFCRCTALETIRIPASITSIEYAFQDCSNLKHVCFMGTKSQWDSINISKSNNYLLNASIHYMTSSTITREATCATSGIRTYKCSECSYTFTETIPALGHKYNIIYVDTPPTCAYQGSETHECSVCGDSYKVSIARLSHSYSTQYTIDKQPTCTTKGRKSKHCVYEGCNVVIDSVSIPALGHTETIIPSVEATCTETGLTAGVMCSVCEVVLTEQKVTELAPHTFTNYISNNDATCTVDGTKTAKCDNCEATETVTDTGSKLPHKFVDYTDDNNATCTSDATKTGICEDCGATDVVTIPGTKLPHQLTEWETTQTPDCTEAGEEKRICENCDYYEINVLEALGHTEKVLDAVPATCTSTGLTEGRKCTVCGVTTQEQRVIDRLPHKMGDWYITLEPTCTKEGEERSDCDNCDYYETRLVAETGHTGEILEAVLPTCSTPGLTEGKKCSVCGIILETQKEIKRLPHEMGEWHITVDPTCTEEGESKSECLNCDYYETERVEALAHTEKILVPVPATCTNTGLTEGKQCARCGVILEAQEVVDMLPHEMGDWYTTQAPTCTETGEEKRECANCDYYETNILEATGHSEETLNAVPATCTSTGLTEGKKCSVCNTILAAQEITDMLPHTMSGWYTTNHPTCTETGLKRRECMVCNLCETDIIEANGHTEVQLNSKAATCTTTGLTAGKKCTVCGTITAKQQSVKALGHKEVTIPAKSATYTSTGLTAGKKCSVCGKITVAQKTIAKLTLGKVDGLKAKKVKVAKKSEITLSWTSLGDGVRYEVYIKNGKKWTKLTTTSKTSYTVKKDGKKKYLKADKEYQFRVRAVVDDIKGTYSSTLKVETIPSTATLKLKAGSKQLTASWRKVSDISGYEIQYSTSKKMKSAKKVNAKKSAKSTTIKRLTKGKKYYVRIRTYKTVNGKKIYSDWSTVKNVKVK
ncbi:MAG: leucine-rich repeat protein [Clostridia bacterium]|nr:leucine-rich repeat protein [Clostridia bacterium]